MADITMINAVQDFLAAMADCGIRPVDALDHDLLAGKFVRFKAVGDTRPNSWAVFHQDGRPAGAFGCNKRQIKEKWKADGELRVFTKEERKSYAIEMAAKRASVAAEKAAIADAVAHRASSLLRRARVADDNHPYLTRKKISGAGLSQVEATLIVPMHDAQGKIWNAQFISPEGQKRFYTGGRTDALCWSIHKQSDRVFVGEGMATMSAVHRATACTVYAAFSAGNLTEGAKLARLAYPDADITICADDDAHLVDHPNIKRNIGLDAAHAAAAAIGGRVAVPSRRN